MAFESRLQIPISSKLNTKLKKRVEEEGFSSVNEVARLLLTQFADGKLNISFGSNTEECVEGNGNGKNKIVFTTSGSGKKAKVKA